MLRILFVFGIISVGAFYSLKGPFYALLFYLWNAYFRPEEWVWNDVLWSLRLSLTIGAFLLLASIPSLQNFRLTRQTGLILLFLGHSVLSVFTSAHQELAQPFLIEFAKIIVITLLITVLVDTKERFRLTLAVIAFSLGFEAAKQGWAQLVLNPGATNNNPHLMLGDNNGVAMGMMMLIPIFTALAQTSRTKVERNIHRFFIGGVIYRGISTYSRGGFLAGLVVALFSLWRAQHRLRAIVIIAVVGSIVASVMPQQFWDRMQTITASEDERDSSAASRLYYWGLASQMAADHPLTGVGFNSFRYSYNEYTEIEDFGAQRAVHSSWFGVLSELGFPGIIIFVALLGGSVVSCRRIQRRAAAIGQREIGIYAAQLQISLLVFVVGGTFLNAQYLELLWHLFALVAALERIAAAAETAGLDAASPALPVPARPAGRTVPKFRPEKRPPAAAVGLSRERTRR